MIGSLKSQSKGCAMAASTGGAAGGGFESPSLADQVAAVKRAFAGNFGREAQWLAAAPGRVNLIGEHTDYNAGFVFPLAIERYVVMAAAPGAEAAAIACASTARCWARRRNSRSSGSSPSAAIGRATSAERSPDAAERGLAPGPLDVLVDSNVPLGGGLSSSAALEVATATLVEAATGRTLDPVDKARLCQKAEHVYAGMPCGIMDQFSSALGAAGKLLLIDCRTETAELVPLDDPGVAVLVINSNVKHELTGSEYPERRASCEEAARLLGVAALRDVTSESLEAQQGKLEPLLYRRARHVVGENERTVAAAAALQARRLADGGQADVRQPRFAAGRLRSELPGARCAGGNRGGHRRRRRRDWLADDGRRVRRVNGVAGGQRPRAGDCRRDRRRIPAPHGPRRDGVCHQARAQGACGGVRRPRVTRFVPPRSPPRGRGRNEALFLGRAVAFRLAAHCSAFGLGERRGGRILLAAAQAMGQVEQPRRVALEQVNRPRRRLHDHERLIAVDRADRRGGRPFPAWSAVHLGGDFDSFTSLPRGADVNRFVSTNPGQSAVTPRPMRPHSWRSDSLNPTRPNLVVEYAATRARPTSPQMLATLSTWASPRLSSDGMQLARELNRRVQVDREQAIPVVGRHVDRAAVIGEPGVVHEDVDAAPLGEQVIDGRA